VNVDASDFLAARKACRRDDWIAWYLAHFLPKRKADGVRAIVAGCRMIRAAVLSNPASGCKGEDVIELIRERVEAPELPRAEFRDEGQHVLAAFDQTVREFEIPRSETSDFISSCAADVATTRYATWWALRRHCRVGGTVATMLAAVLGLTHSDMRGRAESLGAAVRLTSILQTLSADAARGRVYLPLEDLARHRYSERELLEGGIDERLSGVIMEQVRRAREMLDEASEGVCWLAGDGSRVAVATLIEYTRSVLARIERGEAPRRPTLGKMIRLLPRAAKLARRQGVAH
jgi:phytoene synthase